MAAEDRPKKMTPLEMIESGVEARQHIATYAFGSEMLADGIVELFTDDSFLRVLSPVLREVVPGTNQTIASAMKKIKIKCKNCEKVKTCPAETKTEGGYTWIRSPATNCVWVIWPIDQIISADPV